MSEIFTFNSESLEKVKFALSKYPKGREQSAVMSLLDIAQRQNGGWLSKSAIEHVASHLDMPYIKVFEIVTFYSMYYTTPVGKYFVQVCTTSPCLLRGADKIVDVCKEKISENQNELSNNGNCSWTEVECLGACINAPMMQVNFDYYEDLNEINAKEIIDSFVNDNPLKPGSYRGRKNSAPESYKEINGDKNA